MEVIIIGIQDGNNEMKLHAWKVFLDRHVPLQSDESPW
jgi:hypothetical protein